MKFRDVDIKAVNNYVLIKPYLDMDQSNISGLSLDTSFNPTAHAARTGVVVSVPEELYFNPDKTDGMPWLTTMELEVGDEVTYHYLSAITAEDVYTERLVEINGEKHYFIKYDRIFTAKRKRYIRSGYDKVREVKKSTIICLNGFVLVEPVNEKSLEKYAKYMDIPQRADKFYGIVRHIGSLNRHYGNVHHKFHGPDRDDVEIGDTVVFDKNCDIPLQYKLHANLEDNKIFYRIQRRYLLGKELMK